MPERCTSSPRRVSSRVSRSTVNGPKEIFRAARNYLELSWNFRGTAGAFIGHPPGMWFRILQHGARAVALFLVSVGVARCGGSTVAPAPTAPPAVAPAPVPATRLQPTVTGVRPNVVSTWGTWGTITGTQFERGATVKIGDAVKYVSFVSSTELRFTSAPHGVGTVDVTVTNPGGLSATLPASYTYAVPDAFDFNGDWIAHALQNDD